jgi:DNA invertase Pin-like site-specific DNA recombinase
MGNIFTYARVSTLDQNTDMQVEALTAAYPDAVLRQEKKSGTTAKDRFVLNVLLDMIKAGMNPTTLSKEYGVSRGTVYNVIKKTA